MKVCTRGRLACRTASPALSMSSSPARDSPHTTEFLSLLAISDTAWKSPSEAIGKPASMMSTPIASRKSATSSFSSKVMVAPGHCSPSRSVVSKMKTRSLLEPSLLEPVPWPEPCVWGAAAALREWGMGCGPVAGGLGAPAEVYKSGFEIFMSPERLCRRSGHERGSGAGKEERQAQRRGSGQQSGRQVRGEGAFADHVRAHSGGRWGRKRRH